MNPFVLAIDIGTTSTKALAVTQTGLVVNMQQAFYPTHFPFTGHAEQDPNEILRAVKTCIQKVMESMPANYQLAATSFSSAMHSLMAVDATGQPLTPLLIWADTRSTKQARALHDTELGYLLHDRTGTAVHPMSPLCKLLFWKEKEPDLLKAYKFISAKEYILFHLCGEYRIDYSIASATGLFDIQNLAWLREALDLVGIKASQLSEPTPTDHAVRIQDDKDSFSAIKHAPVYLGASDGCLAQLGSQAMNPGDVTITLGTSGAVRTVSAMGVKDEGRKLFRYLLYPKVIIAGGATNNGTVVIDWFGKEFGTGANLVNQVNEAMTVPPGCDGLLALPFLLGERAPLYDADARGVFFNVSPRHSRAHFGRALLEAICFEIRSIVESVVAQCGPSKRIVVSGGFTHAQPWVQLLSDVLQKELQLAGDHDASAMGAAALAFKALGISFYPATDQGNRMTPNTIFSTVYEKQFHRFTSLYLALKEQFIRD